MTELSEGGPRVRFPGTRQVGKYDDWAFYRNQFSRVGHSRAVDFVYVSGDECWLIEVKDYRSHPRTKPTDIEQEVASKVRDTLAGLATARANATEPEERNLAKAALRSGKWRVALHLEQPQHPSRLRPKAIDPASLTTKLRRTVKAIDPHPRVVDVDFAGVPWTAEPIGSTSESPPRCS